MNEDFGASTEGNGDISLKEESSSASSPTAKWFAPSRQPLRSASGKHWNKSRRNEFGNESETSVDGCSSGESSSRETNAMSIVPSAQQPPPARSIHRTDIEKKDNTPDTPISSKVVSSNVKSTVAQNNTNPMRRTSKPNDESPAHTEPIANPADILASPEQSAAPTVTPSNQHRPLKSALSSGSNKVSMQNIYEKPLSYKYLPLELASARTVKNSIAKNILFQSLGHGLLVIKYGRQGGPKKRVLYCDFGVTKLFWSDAQISAETAREVGIETLIDASRMVELSDILEVRAGVDLDPDTPTTALRTAAKAGIQAAASMLQQREADSAVRESSRSEKGKSLLGSIFGGHDKGNELLYGTATLRRKVKPEDFGTCISLITADRSIDFQCLSKKDFNLLHINLKEIVAKLRNNSPLPASIAPCIADYKDNLSRKKSVRFNFEYESKTSTPNTSPKKPTAEGMGFADASSVVSTGDNEVFQIDDSNIDAVLSSPSYSPMKPAPSPLRTSNQRVKIGEESPSPATARIRGVSESVESDSGHNPETFSDEIRELRKTMSTLSGLTVSGLNFDSSTVDSAEAGNNTNTLTGTATVGGSQTQSERIKAATGNASSQSPFRMTAHEALQIGLILSQQEQQFGTNMYQSLAPEDEPEIERLNSAGFSTEEAILRIFQKKYQPDLLEPEEISMDVGAAAEASFDLQDQYEMETGSFKGSIKTIFGRQSSFFPQVFRAGSETESRVSNLTTESKAVQKREDAVEPTQKAPIAATLPASGPHTPPPSYTESFRDHTITRGGGADDDESTVYSQPLPIPPAGPRAPAPTATLTRTAGVVNGGIAQNQYAPAPLEYHELDPRRAEMMHRLPESPSSPVRNPQSAAQEQGTPLLRMTSSDALQIGLLLSQQEAEFGVNMYDSLENSDEDTIRRLVAQGYTNDEAVLEIFNRKYGKTGPQTKWSQVSAAAPVVNRLNTPAPPAPGPSASSYQYQQYEPEPQVPVQYRQQPPPQPLNRTSMYSMGSPPTGPQSMYIQQLPMSYGPGQGPRPGFQRTNSSLAQSSFFPNDPNVLQAQYGTLSSASGPNSNRALSPRTVSRSNMLTTLNDDEAIHMALLLSQQEAEFGVNMYDALRPQDEQELQALIASGYTNEQAVLFLFERRYVSRNAAPIPQPPASMYGAVPPPPQVAPWQQHQQPVPRHQSQIMHPMYDYRAAPMLAPAPRPGPRPGLPQRVPSMMPAAPVRVQSVYGGGMVPPPVPAPATAVVVSAVPMDNGDRGDAVVATAMPAPSGHVRRPSNSSVSHVGPPPGAPSQQRSMQRLSSTASVMSNSGASTQQDSSARPKIAKKRSIFNFGRSGGPDDEQAPKVKYRESDVKLITNMGYSKEQAVWALVQNGNNVTMAIDALCRS